MQGATKDGANIVLERKLTVILIPSLPKTGRFYFWQEPGQSMSTYFTFLSKRTAFSRITPTKGILNTRVTSWMRPLIFTTIIENEGILLNGKIIATMKRNTFLRKFCVDPIGDEDIEPNEVSLRILSPFRKTALFNCSYWLYTEVPTELRLGSNWQHFVYALVSPPAHQPAGHDTSYNQFTIEWRGQ